MLASVLLVSGCGSKKEDAPSSGGETGSSAAGGPKTYTVEQLSKTAKLADTLPPLDSGRIEMAAPEGWHVLPRDGKKHVVAMLKEPGTQLPQMKVHSRESPVADIVNLTPENVQEVIPLLGTSVARPSAEPNQPIILGENAWVREVRKAELQGDKVALQSLTTIRGKRLFIVELIVAATPDGDYTAELKKHRDAAYLMAAEMKFLKPEAQIEKAAPSSEAAPTEEKEPAATEKEPAEEKGATAPASTTEKDPVPM